MDTKKKCLTTFDASKNYFKQLFILFLFFIYFLRLFLIDFLSFFIELNLILIKLNFYDIFELNIDHKILKLSIDGERLRCIQKNL